GCACQEIRLVTSAATGLGNSGRGQSGLRLKSPKSEENWNKAYSPLTRNYNQAFFLARYTKNSSWPIRFNDFRRSCVACANSRTPTPSAIVGAWRPPNTSGQIV